MTIELNMYQTLAMAVIVLVFGTFLKYRIKFLDKFCIPSPVIGGIIFAIHVCAIAPVLQPLYLMIPSVKYAWYFSSPR